MPIIEVPGPYGKKMRMHSEQGYTYPETMVMKAMPAKDLKLQFQWMKEMEAREDDVMVCAYPKTGTHWLWEVLSMLTKEHSEYEKLSKESAMLEFRTKEMIASLPSPRIMNTHHTPPILPAGFIDRKCKIVLVLRNPKDVCVSMYHHEQAMTQQFDINTVTFSDFLRKFLSNSVIGCNYSWFIKEFEKFKKENPDYPLLNVFFEDMKMQPEKEIKRIANFLGKTVSDELASEIAEKCKFDNLKKANDEVKEDLSKKFVNDGNAMMYRKGQIGDWKNHFTVADNEMFDKWIAEHSEGSDITFKYE